jgi:predicted amino acid-binding ACT domain protein
LTRATDGTVQNPGIDLVISAAKGLGTSVGALLGDVEEPLQGHNKLIFEMVDAVGLASAITGVFSRHSVNITKIESETFTVTDLVGQGRDIARFRVEWTSASLTQLLEVLEDLRQHGPFTKAVLISSLDISGSDVLELIAELLQASRNDSRVYGSYLPSSMH